MIAPKKLAIACGPAAVSSMSGMSRVEAAKLILAARRAGVNHDPRYDMLGQRGGLSSTTTELASVMGGHVETLTRPYPTLAQWLRANPRTEAIVRASSHFLHVRDGRIIEDNGVRQMRARVTHVVRRGGME